MRVSPDVDPAEVARWLRLEAERLRRAADDARDFRDRVYESAAGEDAKRCACWLWEEAQRSWWWHTEEFTAAVMVWVERLLERRQFEERQRLAATVGMSPRPWQTGPDF